MAVVLASSSLGLNAASRGAAPRSAALRSPRMAVESWYDTGARLMEPPTATVDEVRSLGPWAALPPWRS